MFREAVLFYTILALSPAYAESIGIPQVDWSNGSIQKQNTQGFSQPWILNDQGQIVPAPPPNFSFQQNQIELDQNQKWLRDAILNAAKPKVSLSPLSEQIPEFSSEGIVGATELQKWLERAPSSQRENIARDLLSADSSSASIDFSGIIPPEGPAVDLFQIIDPTTKEVLGVTNSATDETLVEQFSRQVSEVVLRPIVATVNGVVRSSYGHTVAAFISVVCEAEARPTKVTASLELSSEIRSFTAGGSMQIEIETKDCPA